MARTRNVSTPGLSDVVRSIGWVMLSSVAVAAVLLAQARGDPTAQQPSKLVYVNDYYSNDNCEGRPSTIEYQLNNSVCDSSMIVATADAAGNCRNSSGTSNNSTCKRAVKTDWEMPVPGYMCKISYAGSSQCGEDSSDIDQVECFTMEGLGTIHPRFTAAPGPGVATWSLTPVPESAGSSASTMELAFNKFEGNTLGWSEEMFPDTITNGECVIDIMGNRRYVW